MNGGHGLQGMCLSMTEMGAQAGNMKGSVVLSLKSLSAQAALNVFRAPLTLLLTFQMFVLMLHEITFQTLILILSLGMLFILSCTRSKYSSVSKLILSLIHI